MELHCVGSHIVYVTALQINPLLATTDFAAGLAPFGKVKNIQYLAFKGFPFVDTSSCLVNIKMAKPVLNFIHVRGERVQCEYTGVWKVRSLCNQQAHSGANCTIPWCAKCNAFDHNARSALRYAGTARGAT